MSSSAPTAIENAHTGESHPVSISKLKWLICLLIAGCGTWYGFAYPPIKFEVPKELRNVDPNSPPKLRNQRAVVDAEIHWKSVAVQFGWGGLFFGTVGLTSTLLSGNKRFGIAIATLLLGVASGVGGGLTGAWLRQYFDKSNPLTFLSEDMRPLVSDAIVYSAAGILLLLPVGFVLLFSRQADARQKSTSAILSGLLSGLLAPIAVALGIAFALIPSETNYRSFPTCHDTDDFDLGRAFGSILFCGVNSSWSPFEESCDALSGSNAVIWRRQLGSTWSE